MDQRQDGPLKYYMKHYNSRFKKKKNFYFDYVQLKKICLQKTHH